MGFARNRLQPGGAAPENIVERIAVVGGPGGLCGDQLDPERVRDPTRDLVLESEEFADALVEPFGPQMRIGRGVNQPGGDAYLFARSLNASIQHIAHAELAADPPGGDWLV